MIDIFSIILRKIFRKTGAFCLHLIENKNRNKVFSISAQGERHGEESCRICEAS